MRPCRLAQVLGKTFSDDDRRQFELGRDAVVLQLAPAPLTDVVLVGLESVGKSAIFRRLSRGRPGREQNFRGSTVSCRSARVDGTNYQVIDTPGARFDVDAETTELALRTARGTAIVVVVARATQAAEELERLLPSLALSSSQRLTVVLTHVDKLSLRAAARYPERHAQRLGVPVIMLDARGDDASVRRRVIDAIERAVPIDASRVQPLEPLRSEDVQLPCRGALDAETVGPWLALLLTLAMFAVPVYAAYHVSDVLGSSLEPRLLEPWRAFASEHLGGWVHALVAGPYGVLTLGILSLVWSLPLVALLGAAVAVADDSGLKDRIADALDAPLGWVGLSGRDLVPLLAGYGCNVVAVLQSRTSGRACRQACVSQISLGSACSYQLGGTLAVFSAAGRPQLFAPYLALLFSVGALHTRVWYGRRKARRLPLLQATYLAAPRLGAVLFRMRADLGQFATRALPALVLLCSLAALAEHGGALQALHGVAERPAQWLGLEAQAVPAVVLATVRKDGLLLLIDSASGSPALTESSLLLAVWLGSTLSACSVTLWTISRELGVRSALRIAGRQALTALLSTWLLAVLLTRVAGS